MTKLKAETPALGISRSESWDDTQVYLVECTCTDPNHAVFTWIEVVGDDDDCKEVEVTFYVQTNFRRYENFFQRLKIAWKVLTCSDTEQHHSLLLNKQAALNFAATLEKSIEDLENADTQSNK